MFRVVNRVGNLAPPPGVFPDYEAAIVRTGAEGRELANRALAYAVVLARAHGSGEEACAETGSNGDIWFALDESRPLACLAGIWTTSVWKVKEGETTNEIYAFLTTEPNAEVGAIHPKAMPVILTTLVETWMTGSADDALKLQRPLPDGTLRIVRMV